MSADKLFVLRTTGNAKLRSAARINIALMSKSVVQMAVSVLNSVKKAQLNAASVKDITSNFVACGGGGGGYSVRLLLAPMLVCRLHFILRNPCTGT
jgi:hypothetical protein